MQSDVSQIKRAIYSEVIFSIAYRYRYIRSIRYNELPCIF